MAGADGIDLLTGIRQTVSNKHFRVYKTLSHPFTGWILIFATVGKTALLPVSSGREEEVNDLGLRKLP